MKKHLAVLLIFTFLFSCTSENNPGKIYVLQRMQSSALEHYAYAEMHLMTLHLMATDKNNSERYASRINKLYENAKHVDSLFGDAIQSIEKLKRQLLADLGVHMTGGTYKSLVHYDYGNTNLSRPVLYQFEKIKHSGGSDFLNKTRVADLRKKLVKLRKDVCKHLVKSANNQDYKAFHFMDPQIRDFRNIADFNRQYKTNSSQSNIQQDNEAAIHQIYFQLSKNQLFWTNVLTEKEDWMDAMQALIALEIDVLDARAIAMGLVFSNIGCVADFDFTNFLPVLTAPSTALAGDTIEYTVFMGAYNANRNPSFTTNKNTQLVKIKNGIGYFQTVVPSSGEVELGGTITVYNRSGVPRTTTWRRSVRVSSKKETFKQ